jgi:hypothetical protein
MSVYGAIARGPLGQFPRTLLMDGIGELVKFLGVTQDTPTLQCPQDLHDLLTKLTLACEWLKNAGVALSHVESIIKKMVDSFGPTLVHKIIALHEAFEVMSLTYVVHLPFAASKLALKTVVADLIPYNQMVPLAEVSHSVDFQPLRERFGRFGRPQLLAIAKYLKKPFRDLTTEMCFEVLNGYDMVNTIYEMAVEIAESEQRAGKGGKGGKGGDRGGKGGKGDRGGKGGKGGKGDRGDRGGSWRSA